MNAFASCQNIEAQSMEILTPFIQARSGNGQFILIQKGRLALELQRQVGDAAFNAKDGSLWTVEIKAEQANKYGRLYLEMWSNRSRYTIGWMFTLNADLLLYHFIAEDLLLVINFQKLKQWAFWKGQIYKYEERPQRKYEQLNDTWGRCVPIDDLAANVGLRRFRASTGEEIDIMQGAA